MRLLREADVVCDASACARASARMAREITAR
jgi:hypothetical protein